MIINRKNLNVMKTYDLLKWTMACAMCTFVMTSCSDDDNDGNVNVPNAVETAFNQKYDGVTRVSWESGNGGYLVGGFNKDGRDYDAWFTNTGEWVMTEVDHARDTRSLPQAVIDGYGASKYAQDGWRIDDIDEIQRPGYETIYKIEVEKAGQPDYDLYFDAYGTLFREVADNDDDRNEGLIHNNRPDGLQAFIDAEYPGAKVLDFEREDFGYEMDIRHEGKSKEVLFDADMNWMATVTDSSRDIPANIISAVRNEYPRFEIDDCDYVETAKGEKFYLIELDDVDINLMVTLDGAVTVTPDF